MKYEFRDELLDLYDSMPYEHQRQWNRMTAHLYDYPHRDASTFMPDIVIAPDGNPYLYRWYMVPLDRSVAEPQIMFHLQVASDPERPMHDHPWDNTSHILAGAYAEALNPDPERHDMAMVLYRETGDVVTRKATWAHRLILPDDVPYTMTLFTTGPKIREWGFWYPDGWHDNKRHVAERDGKSVHVNQGGME